ncbi:PREDICTED: zinc finger CCCH domain-containing protein 37 isoform X2 [Theobroma cacao]|uniref:Zinc finger CCCH domain-containing protein 37 isoform X2 n=1 Tax=Theobroma cacao TaxID=3641 RepID=A0AB32WRY7_THECC|nr:PREDICTED: zinc finger CCCH domain-containing protein 37 isoform X2 [Theobroma cacao]
MANQLYGYTPRYSSPSPTASLSSTLQRYLDSETTPHSHLLHHLQPWPPGADVPSSAGPIKRPSEVLYHQNVLDAHNTIGQTEAWYSTSSLVKRPRLESASNLPIYPQRPGEKDCAHYMLTRTCKFGDSCKFDHPIWVPEGGIPDWKEVPLATTSESLPERAGEPDCPYFLKTQRCKFGSKCKFNHPKDKLAISVAVLPERPSEPSCSFYVKTGKCKFGATCKFHHPKDIQIASSGQDNARGEQPEIVTKTGGATADVKPALFHNSKGLPIRPDEVDCPFYLKTGSCKYGSSCRYNHPDRNAFNPPAAVLGHSLVASASNLNIGVVTPAASIYQTIDPRLGQSTLLAQPTFPTLGVAPTVYPQRPGQTECEYYMKTGDCKFGDRCKFHHPIDRSVSKTKQTSEQAVKLTLAGLPRREGGVHCPYYMKTGTCKYGATCKFDHPPPGEVMGIATAQGTSTTVGGEEKGEMEEAETVETNTAMRSC